MSISIKYDDKSIKVLKEQEHIRLRPGMYIGSNDKSGLHHIVWEILDNSIDEALNGHCSLIEVIHNLDGSITISDNGRGIPIGINDDVKKHNPEVVFTMMRSGAKFQEKNYKFSSGLHGIGAAVTTAMSKWLKIDIKRDGKWYQQTFKDGWEVIEKPKILDYSGESKGTSITFLPDFTLFEDSENDITKFDLELIRNRIEEITFINKGLKIKVIDKNTNQEWTYYSKNGLLDFMKKEINNKETVLEYPIHHKSGRIVQIKGNNEEIVFEFVLQYLKNDANRRFIPFTNVVRNNSSSSHVEGFKLGLKMAMNNYAHNNKLLKNTINFSVDDITTSMICIMVVYHPEPVFDSQAKDALKEPNAKRVANKITNDFFEQFFLENKAIAQLMVKNANTARQARTAYQNKIKGVTGDSNWSSQTIAGKLSDCSSKDAEQAELFIVEGNSAGGTAKQARNREIQAILPLRGKIINVEKNVNTMLDNKEIQSLISAFGVGIGEDFDIEKLRYGKIILMTDADVDGAHIRTLLLTFIYRYFEPLIDNDNIYIAKPPLFKIQIGKKKIYAYSDEELEKIISEIKDKYNIQRYKGLGEMNPDQLWETTMNPEKRTLLKVEVASDEEIDKTIIKLMGTDTKGRKEFILENSDKISIDEMDI